MSAPVVLITGTGTSIGKTYVAGALLLAWAAALRSAGVARPQVAGLKPVETGVPHADTEILERLSTFHVKRFPAPYLLTRPVSPHLAAREEGRALDRSVIVDYVAAVRADAPDGIVVELAGGLFSPLAAHLANVDLVRDLNADLVLLIASDRLGVLHDVGATTRAAAAASAALSGIVLVAPPVPDASTGANASELSLVTDLPVLAIVPRGEMAEAAELASIMELATALVANAARGSVRRGDASSRGP